MSLFDHTEGDNVHGDKVIGDKVMGDKKTYVLNHVDLDIGILKDILENNPLVIKASLTKLHTIPSQFAPDERTIPISDKNLQNGLEEFYENFIKRIEQKLLALDKFFQENDYVDDIESAADSIKMFIFTYANRNSMKLEPMIFNAIIQEHTKPISGGQEKGIMKLIIYYLYRYCYIGLKDA
ncbi:hypothetical protein [Sulfurimonas sp. HSL-1716]|uniref:hypothetical protein n=1 Tax=Hydrocurvibacter sulfurireducens TaxID=3131937 RepID=UPI0031F73FD8